MDNQQTAHEFLTNKEAVVPAFNDAKSTNEPELFSCSVRFWFGSSLMYDKFREVKSKRFPTELKEKLQLTVSAAVAAAA